jgi:pantothenate kinase
MGTPVEVPDELAEAAKETAELTSRSMAKQIDHWARLGRAAEQLLKTSDVMALKAHLADPLDAEKVSEARAALQRLVKALVERRDRDVARTLISDTGKPVYEAVPGRADRVAQSVAGRSKDGWAFRRP